MRDLRNMFSILPGPSLFYNGGRPRSMEHAFEISIAKWQLIVDLIETRGVAPSAIEKETCGLCLKYWDYPSECHKCPVAKKTGKGFCKGTPLYDYEDARKKDDTAACLDAAERELVFLRKLAAESSYK